jgi:glycosyltransferase involved in cell wall biosynthesis
MRRLHVLSVAYPLAPAGPDAVGGAEQVLAMLDASLVARGHRSTVIACEGSRSAGALISISFPEGSLSEDKRRRAQAAVRVAIAEASRCDRPDIIHFHGLDVLSYLPPPGIPCIVTLHLPPAWYPPEIWQVTRPDTLLVCVSPSQRAACPAACLPIEVVENGVGVGALAARHARRNFVLNLGRMCREKGQHLAIAAAKRAGVPLLMGGAVFEYPQHRAYFQEEIEPHLGANCRYLGAVGFVRKRRLLSATHCLLLPTTAPETSSLVTMEALACGAPVIAFRSGALPDLIEDGRTGFLVNDEAEMAARIGEISRIDPALCRQSARARFDEKRMTQRYLRLYARLLHQPALEPMVADA